MRPRLDVVRLKLAVMSLRASDEFVGRDSYYKIRCGEVEG